tara:strand:- start:296 stop:1381 length:1086 start_codon:yes stop_codon:yes gene_type:complete
MSSINYKSKYDEYHNKFWKLHHKNNELVSEINDLKMKIDIYERRLLSGEIKNISYHRDHGLVTHSDYGDIFFHKSKCNFNLTNALVSKKVTFHLTHSERINKKLDATNVSLCMKDISAFDILDFGIYKSDSESLNVNELSDELSDSHSGNSFVSCQDVGEESEEPDDNIKTITDARIIWYMNCKMNIKRAGINSWSNSIDNDFVFTWQKNKVNQTLFEKLKVNDLISWYMIGHGYSAIVRVKGFCSLMNKGDLKLHYPDKNEEEIKEHLEWEKSSNCRIIKIPVEFLSYTTLDNCIRRKIGWSTEDWTSGFRGPSAILPKHPKWREQVIEMYKDMKTAAGGSAESDPLASHKSLEHASDPD